MADEIKNVALNITVDDGYQRVPITNKYGDEIGVFYFNPTDIGIIERYNKMAESFDAITAPLEAVSDGNDEKDDSWDARYTEALKEATERLYEAVNELFNADMAAAFFGKVNPFSPVDGHFYCEQALQAVGQFIGQQFAVETEKINARIAKYTNRAQRRAKK